MICTASTALWMAGRTVIALPSLVQDFPPGFGGTVEHLLHAGHDRGFFTRADADRLVAQDRLDELERGARWGHIRVVDIDHLLLAVALPVEGERLQLQARLR